MQQEMLLSLYVVYQESPALSTVDLVSWNVCLNIVIEPGISISTANLIKHFKLPYQHRHPRHHLQLDLS